VQNPSRRSFVLAALPVLTIVFGGQLRAAEMASPVPGKRIALAGYDPVSYFTQARPEKGSREFWYAFDDAVYLFSGAKHRALFAADPERYAPQYHGYCTMKVSERERAEADPEAWVIVEGKLYVFRSKKGLARFNENRAEILGRADAAWKNLRAAR
jgi:YHS domain-containing protein